MANAKCLNCDAKFELKFPRTSKAKIMCPKCGNKATVEECYIEYDNYITKYNKEMEEKKKALEIKKKEEELKRQAEALRQKEEMLKRQAMIQKEIEANKKAMELEKARLEKALPKKKEESNKAQITYKNGIYNGEFKIVDGKRVKEGYGIFKSNDNDIYKGMWKSDLYDGEGEYKSGDGFFNMGTFEKGKLKSGKTKRKLVNGVYEGDIDNFIFDGHGKVTLNNGQEYEGEFKEGKRSGKGSCTYPGGERYEGSWVNDMREGKGTIYYSTGEFDEATWHENGHLANSISYYHDSNCVIEKREYDQNGKLVKKTQLNKNTARAGQVIIQTPSGLFIGDVRNNKINGIGTYYYNNGDIYEGSFRDNSIDGSGVYHFNSGDKAGDWQEGSYVNNVITGQAFYYYKDGRIESRRYDSQGKLIGRKMLNVNTLEPGQRVVPFSNGDIYVGQIMDGERCGKGTYYFANGERYEGFFRENKRHGVGTYFYTDGSFERGSFESGKKNGPFIFTTKDGRKENRIYSCDLLVTDSIFDKYKDWAEV